MLLASMAFRRGGCRPASARSGKEIGSRDDATAVPSSEIATGWAGSGGDARGFELHVGVCLACGGSERLRHSSMV
jgi:hypothetical protein